VLCNFLRTQQEFIRISPTEACHLIIRKEEILNLTIRVLEARMRLLFREMSSVCKIDRTRKRGTWNRTLPRCRKSLLRIDPIPSQVQLMQTVTLRVSLFALQICVFRSKYKPLPPLLVMQLWVLLAFFLHRLFCLFPSFDCLRRFVFNRNVLCIQIT
jgi:hypothetical protein